MADDAEVGKVKYKYKYKCNTNTNTKKSNTNTNATTNANANSNTPCCCEGRVADDAEVGKCLDGGDVDHGDDDGDGVGDDIYIMMSVCLSVTKNHHFLLGVSCDHLNYP